MHLCTSHKLFNSQYAYSCCKRMYTSVKQIPPLSPPSHASSLLPPQAVFVLSLSGQVQSGCGRFLGQRCLCNSCLGNFILLFMSSPLLFLLPALFPFSPSVPLAPVRSLSITWFGCHSYSHPSPTCVIHFPPSGFD